MISKTCKLCFILGLVLLTTAAFANVQPVFNGPFNVGHLPPQGPTDEDSVIFSEDFESGMGDWTTVDVTAAGLTWHKDDFNAYQGMSWWSGDSILGGYADHWLQYLVTPTFSLVGVTNPQLTFNLYYSVEDTAGVASATGGEFDGWDGCNVWLSYDGGNTWRVISPISPAYTCQSMYSFGEEWAMGPGIAGWGGSSGGWLNATFNLNQFVGQSNVKIRFGFCSDPSYCTAQNPSLYGMLVDNVLVFAGAATLVSNNADDPPVPSEFTLAGGDAGGDWWIIDGTTSHSPTHCATCDIDGHYNISNAIESPWLSVPEGYTTYFTFWLHCDMLDWDGDGDNYLEDYYMVEVSDDGITWDYTTLGFYDYGDVGRPGAASAGWEEYLPGLPFNGNTTLDLTSLAGQDIKIRFRVVTDANDDGGIGSGLHIDDFTLWASSLFNNDVGANNIIVPFPTSVSNGTKACTVDLENYGREDQPSVIAFARVTPGSAIPLAPWASITAGQSVTKNFNITLAAPGQLYVDAYTQLPGDENPANDTTTANYIEVTPAHIYELGYDNRKISLPTATFYYWSFDPGNGALVRFVPANHTVPEAYDVTTAKMAFYSPGDFVLHIFDAGSATVPGTELFSQTVNVSLSQILPNWKTFDISDVEGMANRTTPFWIWVESLADDAAQITGDDLHWGTGHYFTYNGSTATQSALYEFYIRVIAEGGLGVEDENAFTPDTYGLAQNFPNPFNPETTINFSLAQAGFTTLRVYNMLGEEVAELLNGYRNAGIQEITFDASTLSSGVYFYQLESGDFKMTKKMVLMK